MFCFCTSLRAYRASLKLYKKLGSLSLSLTPTLFERNTRRSLRLIPPYELLKLVKKTTKNSIYTAAAAALLLLLSPCVLSDQENRHHVIFFFFVSLRVIPAIIINTLARAQLAPSSTQKKKQEKNSAIFSSFTLVFLFLDRKKYKEIKYPISGVA